MSRPKAAPSPRVPTQTLSGLPLHINTSSHPPLQLLTNTRCLHPFISRESITLLPFYFLSSTHANSGRPRHPFSLFDLRVDALDGASDHALPLLLATNNSTPQPSSLPARVAQIPVHAISLTALASHRSPVLPLKTTAAAVPSLQRPLPSSLFKPIHAQSVIDCERIEI